MFNANINGIVKVSPSYETLATNGTTTPTAESNFGITIKELAALAEDVVTAPILRIKSLAGMFDFNLVKFVKTLTGYTFVFSGAGNGETTDVKLLVLDANTSTNSYTAQFIASTGETLGTAAYKNYTANLTPNSHDLIESGTVHNAINQALTSVYTPRGEIASAALTDDLLIAANLGNIYETTDSGTTTADFLQGAGVEYEAGQNIGIIQVGPDTYKFNLMSNSFDLHEYQKQDLTTPLTIHGTQYTTVEGALSTLKDDKVTITADGVKTTAELIEELIETAPAKISRRSVLIIQNGQLFLPVTYIDGSMIIFNASTANDLDCHVRNVYYDGTSVYCYIWEFDTSGNGVSSFGSAVPTEGEVLTLVY